jgi:hypothetical protein
VKHSIFALELCMRLEPGSSLRSELRELVVQHPVITDPGPKWSLLQRITELLVMNQHLYERGCWDFFDTDAKALKDYDMWCNGMVTEEGARTAPSGAVDPYRQEPRYMTFTIALLLMNGTSMERELADLCDVPDSVLWRKSTFTKILSNLRVVNFAFVKSDVFYLIPGDEAWGLTSADLQDPKFEYLRLIE